jgi:hypothetical protein
MWSNSSDESRMKSAQSRTSSLLTLVEGVVELEVEAKSTPAEAGPEH